MKRTIRLQLNTMMFLNFFVWGIWFVTMGTYLLKGNLTASGEQTGLAYGTQSLGAILAPFIIGLVADKYFSAQKILGILHIAGAVLLYFIQTQSQFQGFYLLLLLYMILYMPTLALVNTIALKQMSNAKKEFPVIRMYGTIGWIVSGLIIGYMAWEQQPDLLKNTFRVAAVISLCYGAFCFTLPDTPPAKKGTATSLKEILGLDSLKLLKDRNYLLFFIASVIICIPLAFYYAQANVFLNETGMEKAAEKMVLGQVSELIFLFLMPLFFRRYGVKQMLVIGMVAWVARYTLFAYGNVGTEIWMLYLGIILHGVCYDFFFVTGQLYTDYKAEAHIKASAQGLITLATYGVGMYIGFYLVGLLIDYYTLNGNLHNWKAIWFFPSLIAAGVTLLFILLFSEKKTPQKKEGLE